MFLLERVWKRVWKNKFMYLVVMIELTIGIFFITYFLSNIFSYNESREELLHEFSRTTISLEINYKKGYENSQSVPFDYADYETLNELVSKIEVYLCKSELLLIEESIQEFYFIYTNKLNENNIIRFGDKLQEEVFEKHEILDGMNGFIQENKMVYRKKEYIVKELPVELQKKVIVRHMAEDRIYGDESFFLSLKDLDTNCVFAPAQVIIRYEVQNSEEIEDINNKIINILSEKHPEYLFSTGNYLDSFDKANESSIEYVTYMIILAILGIWIFIFGYLGITRSFYLKRQKEYAVCLAVGAKKKTLFCENLIENLLVIIGGSIGGNVIAWIVLLVQKSELYVISYQIKAVWVSVIISLLLVIVINLPIWLKIKKMYPEEILKTL